ncbi:MAG: SGNH/GDSL hydrolase family protein [Actinomycetota bacterium]
MRRLRKNRTFVYVAIGASDTVGVGAANPQKESWVALLHSRLPRGSKFLRLGVDGSTVAQAVQQQLPAAREVEADLVTVWLATNDFDAGVGLKDYEKSLAQLLEGTASCGTARIFIGNVPDLTQVPRYHNEPPESLKDRILQWNGAIAAVAGQYGATVIDLYQAGQAIAHLNLPLIADDGFHPSTFGYSVIADLFWNSISADPVLGPVLSGEDALTGPASTDSAASSSAASSA